MLLFGVRGKVGEVILLKFEWNDFLNLLVLIVFIVKEFEGIMFVVGNVEIGINLCMCWWFYIWNLLWLFVL